MNVVGDWTVTIKTPMGPQEGTLTLDDEGTGSFTSVMGEAVVKEYSVDGDTLTYSAAMGPIGFEFEGVVNGDTFEGKATTPMGKLGVTAVRA